MGSRQTNVMVVGERGAGKTATHSQVIEIFLAKHDASQIKALYTDEEGERMEEDIRQNGNMWYPPKSGDEGQQK